MAKIDETSVAAFENQTRTISAHAAEFGDRRRRQGRFDRVRRTDRQADRQQPRQIDAVLRQLTSGHQRFGRPVGAQIRVGMEQQNSRLLAQLVRRRGSDGCHRQQIATNHQRSPRQGRRSGFDNRFTDMAETASQRIQCHHRRISIVTGRTHRHHALAALGVNIAQSIRPSALSTVGEQIGEQQQKLLAISQ